MDHWAIHNHATIFRIQSARLLLVIKFGMLTRRARTDLKHCQCEVKTLAVIGSAFNTTNLVPLVLPCKIDRFLDGCTTFSYQPKKKSKITKLQRMQRRGYDSGKNTIPNEDRRINSRVCMKL